MGPPSLMTLRLNFMSERDCLEEGKEFVKTRGFDSRFFLSMSDKENVKSQILK